jgi:putative CocE/NonD family hydrolase
MTGRRYPMSCGARQEPGRRASKKAAMRLRIALLLSLCVLTAGITVGAPSAGAAAAPRGAAVTDAFFPSGDGTVLHAEVALPEGGCDDVVNADGSTGCPTIVSMGPYYGSGVQEGVALGYGDITGDAIMSGRFFDFYAYEFDTDGDSVGDTNIFEMGYAVVQVDSRGYGSSGGCNDYGGHGEQMDAAAAITWAGSQDWSNGQVGMWGKSYDAWTQVMALAENPPHLEAVVIQAPIIDGYGIAYVNGVHHDSGWYATTDLYALYDYSPNSINEDPQGHVNATTGILGYNPHNNGVDTPACWAQQNVEVLNPDRDWYFWQERDLRPRASRNDDVAVFYVHGFTDVNTKPDQIFGVYDGLTAHNGDQTRAWFGQWNHVRGTDVTNGGQFTAGQSDDKFVVGRGGFHEEALDWFEHYLRGEEFQYAANAENVVEVQDNLGQWRTEHTYPAPDTNYTTFPLNSGSYTDDGGSAATHGYWTMSEPVTEVTRIAGESIVTIDATISVPGANFVGVLYDLDESGRAEEIGRSAYRLTESGEVTFRTQPGDWVLEPGDRLAFHVTAGHAEYFPYSTRQTVTINSGSITVPFLTYEREVNLSGVQTTARSLYTKNGVNAAIVDASVNPEWVIPDTLPATAAGGQLVQPNADRDGFAPERPASEEDEE